MLTYQFIEFSIRHIEKQQTKKPAITPVKKFTLVGKNTMRLKSENKAQKKETESNWYRIMEVKKCGLLIY